MDGVISSLAFLLCNLPCFLPAAVRNEPALPHVALRGPLAVCLFKGDFVGGHCTFSGTDPGFGEGGFGEFVH